MRISYIRVSSADQNTARQWELLQPYNIEKVYEEKISGKDTNRPKLQEMLSFVREGDVVYIESISRLARNTKDFLNIVEQLNNKNVKLISIKESIDTSTPSGKFMLTVFAALSQLERENIKDRQNLGIQIALQNGVRFGRKSIEIDSQFKEVYQKWQAEKISAVDAMRLCNMKKSTFYRKVKEYETELQLKQI